MRFLYRQQQEIPGRRAMRNLWLVISRELLIRIRKPSFIWLTLAGPVIIALFAIAAIKIGEGARRHDVLVIDEGVILNESLNESKLARYHYSENDVSNQEFKQSKYDLLVYINPKFAQNNKVIIQYRERPSPYVVSEIIRQLEYRLERLKLKIHNVDPDSYAHIKQPVDFKVVNIDGLDAEYDKYRGYAGIVFGAILLFFIALYGMQVMRGVVEEKQSRVIEIMASTVAPFQLMAGKILGIGMAAILQFSLWCLLTFGLLQWVRSEYYPDQYNPEYQASVTGTGGELAANGNIQVNDVAEIIYSAINYPVMLGYFVFFFIFGYLLYASIFASAGAMVDNDTDAQPLLFGLLLPLLLGFVASWALVQNPAGDAAMWASIIPFTAPVVMMTRIALGIEAAQVWQLWFSMALLCFTFVLITWVSSRIYRAGILRYGRRMRLKDLLKR